MNLETFQNITRAEERQKQEQSVTVSARPDLDLQMLVMPKQAVSTDTSTSAAQDYGHRWVGDQKSRPTNPRHVMEVINGTTIEERGKSLVQNGSENADLATRQARAEMTAAGVPVERQEQAIRFIRDDAQYRAKSNLEHDQRRPEKDPNAETKPVADKRGNRQGERLSPDPTEEQRLAGTIPEDPKSIIDSVVQGNDATGQWLRAQSSQKQDKQTPVAQQQGRTTEVGIGAEVEEQIELTTVATADQQDRTKRESSQTPEATSLKERNLVATSLPQQDGETLTQSQPLRTGEEIKKKDLSNIKITVRETSAQQEVKPEQTEEQALEQNPERAAIRTRLAEQLRNQQRTLDPEQVAQREKLRQLMNSLQSTVVAQKEPELVMVTSERQKQEPERGVSQPTTTVASTREIPELRVNRVEKAQTGLESSQRPTVDHFSTPLEIPQELRISRGEPSNRTNSVPLARLSPQSPFIDDTLNASLDVESLRRTRSVRQAAIS